MRSLKTILASYTISSKLDPDKLTHYIDNLHIKRSTTLDYVYPNNIKIATVHMRLTAYKNLKAFVGDCNRLIESAVKGGAQMVVFPHLFGIVPLSIDQGAADVVTQFSEHAAKLTEAAQRAQFSQIIEQFSTFLFDAYYYIFTQLSQRYNIYIAPGGMYVPEKEGIFYRSFLFSPDHQQAFMQDKINLTPEEKRMGVSPAEELHLIDLKIGATVLLADSDAQFYECFKVAKHLGAQIALCPALAGPTAPYPARYNTCLLAAQQQGLFTIRSSFFSRGDLVSAFGGASGIYAPLAMSKGLDGVVLHMQESGDDSSVLCARIDPPKLTDNTDSYMACVNPVFNDVLVNQIYPAYWKNADMTDPLL